MKLDQIDFSRYEGKITLGEVKCKCGKEHDDFISQDFLDRLFRARMLADTPFVFTSVCRCKGHNQEVGGNGNSGHVSSKNHECCAADIHFNDSYHLSKILRGLYSEFWRIGVNVKKKFVHVDNKPALASFWLYPEK
jgi:hypothetical protein